jgi:hypothetical protein
LITLRRRASDTILLVTSFTGYAADIIIQRIFTSTHFALNYTRRHATPTHASATAPITDFAKYI